jgi:sugar phosphate isomerase/epimerase
MTQIAMGAWTFIFPPFDQSPQRFDDVLDRASTLGFEGVEVGWFAPHPTVAELSTERQRHAYRASFEERGLGMAGAVVANFDSCPSVLASDDNHLFLAAVETQANLCAELGIGSLRLDISDRPEVLLEMPYERAFERLVTTFEEAAVCAARSGVRVAWEFEPGCVFNKPSEITRIVNTVNHPSFGVIYDTTHAHNCVNGHGQVGEREVLEGGQIGLLAQLTGRIVHVHLMDADGTLYDEWTSNHIALGQGDIEWESVMPALIRAGSGDPWWTLDVCWRKDAWSVFEQSLPIARRLKESYAATIAPS